MHPNRLDLNLFVVLDAIHAEGNITRAARRLNLTQPALSHALGRLRAVFGDPLFVRRGSAMVPTPLTRSLIGDVQQALKTLTLSAQRNRAFDPAEARRGFTVGVRDVLESRLLPPLMAALRAEAPAVTVAFVRIERREVESELAAGTLDLAVDLALNLSERVRRVRLLRDTLVVVARDDHPAIGPDCTLEDYLRQGHILVSSRRQGMGLEDMELARMGRHRSVVLRCQQYFAACRVVARTDLLLTMPEQYAHTANTNLPNRILPAPFTAPPLDVHLYWHEAADADPAIHWLRERIRTLSGTDATGDTGVADALR